MIAWLANYFDLLYSLKLPLVFTFYSTKMALAALTSLLFVLVLGPPFIRALEAVKGANSIRTEDSPVLCQLHQKKKNTPSMGGGLILGAMILSMLLWMDLTHVFTLILFVTTLFFGALGARDDFLKLKYKNSKGVSGRVKLFFQVLFSCFLAVYLLWPAASESVVHGGWFHIPVIKEPISTYSNGAEAISGASFHQLSLTEYATRFYIPFIKDAIVQFHGVFILLAALLIVFVVTGSSNAVNLTDGLDGLAAGSLIMVGSCLALFAFVSNNLEISRYLNILYIEGSGEIAIYLSALIGACIGFLWYNGSPAQIFMGDVGSLSLGAIIGVAAVLLRREALLALIGGVFVAETLSVILQVASYKFRNKKRIFRCAPLHHHYECKGWPETKVVIRFWIIGLLLAIIGAASLKLQ